MAKAASETRQINGIAVETVEDLIIELRDCIVKALNRRAIHASLILNHLDRDLLVRAGDFVESYLRSFGNKIETSKFAAA